MIKVEMHGRLGNQLFQYATARMLQEQTKQELEFSFKKITNANTEGNIGWENSLKYFKVKPYKEFNGKKNIMDDMNWWNKMICYSYALSYRPLMKKMDKWYNYQIKWCPLLDRLGIRWLANGYYDFENINSKNFYLNGSFEAPQYFDKIKDLLNDEIQPKNEKLKKNIELYNMIEKNKSVCVSLRHFKLNGYEKNLYDVCDYQYYMKALEIMKEKLCNPLFVFFSDDMEWVRNTFALSKFNYVCETEDNPIWEKLRLMYSCDHFIIPNSTFAWWAQYLGRNKDKIVIGPSRWFNNNYNSPLIDDSWITLG